MEEIDPNKIKSRNTEYIDDEWLLEIMIREPWSNPEESARNQYARTYLHDEREFQEIFCFPVLFFDDIFREKIVQTLSTTEIVECSEQAHKTNHTIDHTHSFDREIMGDYDLDHVAKWTNEEGEKVKPKSFFDKFLCQRFFRIEHCIVYKQYVPPIVSDIISPSAKAITRFFIVLTIYSS